MNPDQSIPPWRLLLFETEGLVGDRLRQMARAEGFETCAVDGIGLFDALRSRFEFDLFVVGVRSPAELENLQIEPKPDPLVLLAPLEGAGRPSAGRSATSSGSSKWHLSSAVPILPRYPLSPPQGKG